MSGQAVYRPFLIFSPMLRFCGAVLFLVRLVRLSESFEQMLSDAERIGHNGQGWVHCTAGREEAAVHHVQIIKLVRLAVDVEDRGLGVAAEPDRPILVCHASQWDASGNVGV